VLLLFLQPDPCSSTLTRAHSFRLAVIVTTLQEKTLDTIFPVKITEQNLSTVDEEAKDVKRAFLYYFLIKTLADHDKDNQKHVRVATMHLPSLPVHAGAHTKLYGCVRARVQLNRLLEGCNGALALRKGTASIEIVRDNKLERIYFQRPRICKQLSPMSKKNLLHNVNRYHRPFVLVSRAWRACSHTDG
jgi:hypothetical protein